MCSDFNLHVEINSTSHETGSPFRTRTRFHPVLVFVLYRFSMCECHTIANTQMYPIKFIESFQLLKRITVEQKISLLDFVKRVVDWIRIEWKFIRRNILQFKGFVII